MSCSRSNVSADLLLRVDQRATDCNGAELTFQRRRQRARDEKPMPGANKSAARPGSFLAQCAGHLQLAQQLVDEIEGAFHELPAGHVVSGVIQ